MAKLAVFVVGDASSAKAAMAETGTAAEGMAGKVEAAAVGMKDAALGVVKAFVPLAAAFGAAEFLKGAIDNAENLKKAQDSLAVSIQHTGGNMAKLEPEYAATAKAAAQYGVDVVTATTGLARATLLTGNAVKAQRAYREALVISKATGKDFNAVLTATSKGQEGVTTSLQRYGIMIKKGTPGQEQFNKVMERFGGQAAANTNASDKLRANWENLQTTVGTKLLPAFNAIVEGLNRVIAWIGSPGVQAAFQRFEAGFMAVMQPIIDWTRQHWPEISKIITDVATTIRAVVEGVISIVEGLWHTFGSTIITMARNDWNYIKGTVQNAMEVIRGIIDLVAGLIHGDWGRVWEGIKEIVGGTVKQIWNILSTAVRQLGAVASLIGNAIWNGIKAGAIAAINWIIGQLNHLVDAFNATVGRMTFGALSLSHIGTIGGANPPTPGGVGLAGPAGHAKGGIATRATLGIFGEAGPEALIPLNRLSQYAPAMTRSSGGDIVFQPGAIVVHGSADATFARVLAAELATQLRGGRVPAFQQAIAAI